MSDFVHLHNHTEYSLLDGLSQIEQMVAKVESLGQSAVAITDHGWVAGAVKLVKECKEKDIKPIIGMETYVSTQEDMREPARDGGDHHHLTLLAATKQGYQNLVHLTSMGHLDGLSYQKPRIDKLLLRDHSEGLILLTGCIAAEVPQLLIHRDKAAAESLLRWYQEVFGDRVFVELMSHGGQNGVDHVRVEDDSGNILMGESELNDALLDLAAKCGVGVVATNDAHYLEKDDGVAHDYLLCLGTGSYRTDQKLRFPGAEHHAWEFYIKSADEMREACPEPWWDAACRTTADVADMIDADVVPIYDTILPKIKPPRRYEKKTTADWLRDLVVEGMRGRFDEPGHPILDRIDHELEVIIEAGYPEYFLIVWDVMKYCRENEIPVGPGRGSVCGSMVAYCLFITDVDPMRFDIPFERFLHLDRKQMPDIDLDICYDRRGEVIQYLHDKYGEENVAQIITFGKLQAKAVVRDMARVMKVDLKDAKNPLKGRKKYTGDILSGLIPEGSGADQWTIEQALSEIAEFKEYAEPIAVERDGEWAKLLDVCQRLEGMVRHGSVHSAGVVIADRPLIDIAPLCKRKKDADVQVQFDYKDAEHIGLLKLDVLGLRTVTVVWNAAREAGIDLNEVPLSDPQTFDALSQGDTKCVFQLEGEGITDAIKGIQPDRFDDIIATIALYRPGPMEQLGSYIRRKHGKEPIEYAHPDLEPILERTYGLIVFQEQVMNIARKMAGYSPGEADIFRKAIGKKIPELIAEQIKEFEKRAIENDYEPDLVEQIGKQITYFGRYGFNLGHATGYAFLTYWSAYLKVHHPTEFYTATLNSYLGKMDKIADVLADAGKHGIQVLGPDINTSGRGFVSPEPNVIRFGLEAVKNLGDSHVQDILEERDNEVKNEYDYTGGSRTTLRVDNQPRPYDGPWDFCNRLSHVPITAKKALAAAGAFGDDVEYRRRLVACLEDLNKTAKKDKPYEVHDWTGPLLTEIEIMRAERETMGFYVTSHPLDHFKEDILRYQAAIDGSYDDLPGRAVVAGIVMEIRPHKTKNKKDMAWVVLETGVRDMPECTVFPSEWKDCDIEEDDVVIVKGKKQNHAKFGRGFIVEDLWKVSRSRPEADKVIVSMPDTDPGDLAALYEMTEDDGVRLFCIVEEADRLALVRTNRYLSITGASLKEIEKSWPVCIDMLGGTAPWIDGQVKKTKRTHQRRDGSREAVWDLPIVKMAKSMFGGRVVAEMEKV